MEHPKKQVSAVIKSLTMGSPLEQRKALETYFTPDASFIHPLCRVDGFKNYTLPLIGEINSRWVIWMIYRWYKILSPKILLNVETDEFDQKSNILFVEIHQIFSLFFVPFYKSDVHLTTKLDLVHGEDKKWYIRKQEDLYQSNEVVKFFWPGGSTIIFLFQLFATFLCIVGALALAPVTWAEQRFHSKKALTNGSKH